MKPASFSNTFRRAMRPTTLLATALAMCGAASVQALPVIPGSAGFGMETKAGRGGTVYRVTTLGASGAGSLKACIDATGPRTCVFEVSGVIRLTSDLIIRNDQIRIAGQTAPSPGIMLRGAALLINASDVLVQHIRIRTGDDPVGPNPDNRDSLKITGNSTKTVHNVVIDHCSFSWALDEVASTWGPHDNITFTNNIFAEPLNESLHPQYDGTGVMPHGYGVLFGPSDNSSITFVGNLLAHIVERNPLSRAAELVMVNNLVYNRGTMDVQLESQDGRVTRSSVVGNEFLRGPSFSRPTRPIFVFTSSDHSMLPGSRVYVNDNRAPDSGSTYSELVTLTGGDVIPNLMTQTTAPVWNTGLVVRNTAASAVYSRVLSFAGARPTDRDSVDKRVVDSVRTRTGQIINCVSPDGTTRCKKNAGGWPSYAQNHRTLTLPANQASIASNGYSNLENWLNSMDQSMDGVVQASSPTSPPALSVQ
jgi:pectate lyase